MLFRSSSDLAPLCSDGGTALTIRPQHEGLCPVNTGASEHYCDCDWITQLTSDVAQSNNTTL